jgi:hypothetical protein
MSLMQKVGYLVLVNLNPKMFSKIALASQRLIMTPKYNYGITPQFMHPLDADLLLD